MKENIGLDEKYIINPAYFIRMDMKNRKNDGVTDCTGSIVEQYVPKGSRIKINN